MSTGGMVSPKPGKKTAPEGAVQSRAGWAPRLLFLLFVFLGFFLLRVRGGSGRSGGGRRSRSAGGRSSVGLERGCDAVLHDRDRHDLAALELEDRHLGVLAVAL